VASVGHGGYERVSPFDRHNDHGPDVTLGPLCPQKGDRLFELCAFGVDAAIAFEPKPLARDGILDINLSGLPRGRLEMVSGDRTSPITK